MPALLKLKLFITTIFPYHAKGIWNDLLLYGEDLDEMWNILVSENEGIVRVSTTSHYILIDCMNLKTR